MSRLTSFEFTLTNEGLIKLLINCFVCSAALDSVKQGFENSKAFKIYLYCQQYNTHLHQLHCRIYSGTLVRVKIYSTP